MLCSVKNHANPQIYMKFGEYNPQIHANLGISSLFPDFNSIFAELILLADLCEKLPEVVTIDNMKL